MESNSTPLVSLITPCYNGEVFLDRFLKSLLDQDYLNVEIFFVDDGSNDRTKAKAMSYRKPLEDKGYRFTYIYQTNQGQAAALNQALPLIKGKYLICPDSDDVMYKDSISERVRFLETHPSCGLVIAPSDLIDEESQQRIGLSERIDAKEEENIFGDVLFVRNVAIYSTYMFRTSSLLPHLKGGQIYAGRQGQNWQLILPIAYEMDCGYINRPLGAYYVRQQSHSHSVRGYQKSIERADGLEAIILNTFETIAWKSEEEKADYTKRVKTKYERERCHLHAHYLQRNKLVESLRWLKENDKLTRKEKLLRFLSRNNLYFFALKAVIKFRSRRK
jgi:glycosyltransferase involved in cell wall biosynthesis